MKTLIQYHQNLSSKEQKLLNIGLFTIIFFFIYQFIYAPFQEKISQLANQQAFQQELNAWFKQIEPKLKKNTEGSAFDAHIKTNDLLAHSLASVKQGFDPIAYKL